ncbi:fibrinogen related protein 12.1 [Plakobranchus ocellatus]|uniref:Fibrinogen related protein 12.1 n=1 Tax=Plakobranchus ocellatus TaxID=259542 RepID=A0AAV3YY04_9GAST|nr:fibrinogen related protein 12.1 [Plakobranchus ocellatus]
MARVMTKALLLVMIMVMKVCAETKDVAESLFDLERKLAEISASLNKTNETHAQLRGHQELPTTCERGMGDDITKTYPRYVIMSHDGLKKQILCDTHTDGGGWVVFQDPYELRIDIRINNGQEVFARYPDFRIESESNKYRLQIGSYTGTAGDAMAVSKKMFFSTFDRDNDQNSISCAVYYRGAWWYKDCHHAALNREWIVTEIKGHAWYDGKKWWQTSFTEMKMRRIKLI